MSKSKSIIRVIWLKPVFSFFLSLSSLNHHLRNKWPTLKLTFFYKFYHLFIHFHWKLYLVSFISEQWNCSDRQHVYRLFGWIDICHNDVGTSLNFFGRIKEDRKPLSMTHMKVSWEILLNLSFLNNKLELEWFLNLFTVKNQL
jgi:hypothetical protein